MKPKQQIAANERKAQASGYRLQYGRVHPALATCRAANKVILGGLGAFGNGIMAFTIVDLDIPASTPDFPTLHDADTYVAKEYGVGAINIHHDL